MSAFAIKCVALAAMLIDHLGAVFPHIFPLVFRVVGRMAFPLFAFLSAEACRHTRSLPHYLKRLGIFAVISQLPFALAFIARRPFHLSGLFVYDTNIFYTIFLGVLGYYFYVRLREKGKFYAWGIAPVAGALAALGYVMDTDYGAAGVLFITGLAALHKKSHRLAAMAFFVFYMYGDFLWEIFNGAGLSALVRPMNMIWAGFLAGGLAAVGVAALYTHKKGPGGPLIKWMFYIAYPLHLTLLAAAKYFL
jgi:hypothetical protein